MGSTAVLKRDDKNHPADNYNSFELKELSPPNFELWVGPMNVAGLKSKK